MPVGSRARRTRSRCTTLLLAVAVAFMGVLASLAPQAAHAAATPTVSSLSPEAGPTTGGTAVTLTGSNFDSTATVSFGSTPALNLKVISSTVITFSTPAMTNEGQVQVTVTTTTGGTSTAGTPSTTFEFTNPGPFVPLNADICDNQPDGNTTQCAAHGPLSNVAG